MNELIITTETLEGSIRLRLRGALDGGAAYALRDRIAGASSPVVVDCSQLQHLSDFGLGILAMALPQMEQEVQFVGLGHHAQRILRAFGVSHAA